MTNTVRYLLWTLFSLAMIIIAVMFFWFFLIILGVAVIARIIYLKLFRKEPANTGTITFYTFHSEGPGGSEDNQSYRSQDQEYTTVIDADDMDKEYKIPKIK